MYITLFINCLYGGGAERVTCNLANYLVEKGHKVEILTMAETENSYEVNSNVIVKSLLGLDERKNLIYKSFCRIWRLSKYMITHQKVDAYIVMLPKTTILLLTLKFLTKAKIIASERANPDDYSYKIRKRLFKIASKADGYVFQTEEARKLYGDNISKCKNIVLPNAINSEFIRPLYIGKRERTIVGVGRLNDQKNFKLLIDSFANIEKEFKDIKLIIYGEGEKREELQQQVHQHHLDNKVYLPGNVKDIAQKIQKASMFVLTSNYEGMPNALMEAMSLGLPCIATDCPVGGPKFLISNGKNGILVPVGNQKALSEAMEKILENPQFASQIGRKASNIQNELSPEYIYGEWEKFIKKVIE